MEFLLTTSKDCQPAAEKILQTFPETQIFLLEGPPGSGKTTLIQAFMRSLGVEEPVTSPTFALAHLYHNSAGKAFAHLDLYRIGSLEEALEAGLAEILEEPYEKIFIEWPSCVPELFDDKDAVRIFCAYQGPHRRVVVKGTNESS